MKRKYLEKGSYGSDDLRFDLGDNQGNCFGKRRREYTFKKIKKKNMKDDTGRSPLDLLERRRSRTSCVLIDPNSILVLVAGGLQTVKASQEV